MMAGSLRPADSLTSTLTGEGPYHLRIEIDRATVRSMRILDLEGAGTVEPRRHSSCCTLCELSLLQESPHLKEGSFRLLA